MSMIVKKAVKVDNTNKIKQIINTLNNKKIKVGIFGSEGSDLLMIASVSEFGCNITVTPKMRAWLNYNGLHLKEETTEIRIPERSFIRATANEKENEIAKFVEQSLDMLFTFEISIDTFFDRVGTYLTQLTQQTITDMTSPPNHPWTIERKKGKEHVLIDSGRLRSSITYKVE